ncbi:MAG: hypothetical protein LUD54_06000 [Oscillospiraceae bacterium]|nr:hypothetical protein [Oscillospiraceae bacterium]
MNDTRNIVKSQATLRNSTQLFATFIRFFSEKLKTYSVSNAARLDGAAVLPRTFSHMSAWIMQKRGRAQSGLTASAVTVPDCEGHASFKRANHRPPEEDELSQ